MCLYDFCAPFFKKMKMRVIPTQLQSERNPVFEESRKRRKQNEDEDEQEYDVSDMGEIINEGGPPFVPVGIMSNHNWEDDPLLQDPLPVIPFDGAAGGGGGGGETPPPTEMQLQEEKERQIPVPLESIQHERSLGNPGPRSTCFGCCYYGERETTLPSEALNKLVEMSRQSIGRICMVTLAHGMADFYDKKIRIPVNAKLKPNETPLPYWPAAQVLDHIYNHTQDPLIRQVVLLSRTQEIINELECCLFEKSSVTGIKKPNKYNLECYDKMVKLQLLIQKQDASKMAFHSAGARINPEILDQGILTTHNKKLHAYLKK